MITLELDAQQGVALLKCISQSLQNIELSLDRASGPRSEGLKAEYTALNEVLLDLQEAKAELL